MYTQLLKLAWTVRAPLKPNDNSHQLQIHTQVGNDYFGEIAMQLYTMD